MNSKDLKEVSISGRRMNASQAGWSGIMTVVVAFGVAACASSSSPPEPPTRFVTITGYVIKPDSTPVSGATISTIPITSSKESLPSGLFTLANVGPPGEYTIVAQHDSIRQVGRTTVQVTWGVTSNVMVVMGVEQDLGLMSNDQLATPPNTGGNKTIEH